MDDVLQYAKEVGFSVNLDPATRYHVIIGKDSHLQKFAERVKAHVLLDSMIEESDRLARLNDNYNPKPGGEV